MSFDDLREFLKGLKERLDLTKQLKINKNIFRVALLLILGLTLFVGFSDGFDVLFFGSVGMCCDDLPGCHNPFYSPLTSDPMTKDAIIPYGECVGDDEPGWLAQNLGFFTVLIIAGAFAANYFYYRKVVL